MSADDSFQELLRRVRAGDQAAAAQVVRQCEPELRRIVRLRLTDPRMRRVLDSMDICQSVLGNFFVRVAAGQFDLDTPEQLLGLLATMARNKVLNQVERNQAGRRDQRRMTGDGEAALNIVADAQESPSQIVAGQELHRKVRELLTDEERQIADRRANGESWEQIAAAMGDKPDALRKKLTRAMDRVVQELGLDDLQ